jgi:nucleoside-diphosphate-sugar epimerase
VRGMTGGPPICYEPWPAEHAAAESGDYIMDITKARHMLGVSPRHDFARGVALILEATASRRGIGAHCREEAPQPHRWSARHK